MNGAKIYPVQCFAELASTVEIKKSKTTYNVMKDGNRARQTIFLEKHFSPFTEVF